MAKITKVRVWGFESNYQTEYEVSMALTVFTGNSGQGKTSATLRALRWLAKGEPKGEDFLYKVYAPDKVTVLHEAKEAGVEVHLDDGRVVRKTRSKSKTRYYLEPDYSEPFEKAEVPQAIKDALGIRSTSFGDLEYDLNFSYQLDPPFLISQPASAGAKVLGRLAGTEAVDGAIKSVSKDTYASRQRLQQANKEYESGMSRLQAYTDLERIESELDAAEYILGEVDAAAANKEKLGQLLGSYRLAREKIERQEEVLYRHMNLPVAEDELMKAEESGRQRERIADLMQRMAGVKQRILDLEVSSEQYAGLDQAEYSVKRAEVHEIRRQMFADHLERIHQQKAIIERANAVLVQSERLGEAADHLQRAEKAQQEREQLSAIYQSGLRAQLSVERLDRILQAQTAAAGLEEDLETAATLEQRRGQIEALYRQYASRIFTQDQRSEALDRAEGDYQAAQNELAAAWEATGNLCPLCEQPLDTHTH